MQMRGMQHSCTLEAMLITAAGLLRLDIDFHALYYKYCEHKEYKDAAIAQESSLSSATQPRAPMYAAQVVQCRRSSHHKKEPQPRNVSDTHDTFLILNSSSYLAPKYPNSSYTTSKLPSS